MNLLREELTEALNTERERREGMEEEALVLQTELTAFKEDLPRVR